MVVELVGLSDFNKFETKLTYSAEKWDWGGEAVKQRSQRSAKSAKI